MKVMTNIPVSRKLIATALTGAVVLAAFAGGVTQSIAAEEEAAKTPTTGIPAAPKVNTTSAIEGEVTEAEIDRYCYICHLHSDGASWNRDNVNEAMVESMLPSMSDADIAALASYFEAIEPASGEEMH